jgi:ribosome-interacting GTPase 1
MTTRNKEVRRLGAEADSFVLEHSSERFTRGMRLQKAWEAIAPPRALDHTDNVVFSVKAKKPCILVYVDDSHWAAELGTQKELYRILIEKETGWEIDDLKFYVTRKTMFKKLFKKQKEKERQEQQGAKIKTAIPLNEAEDRYARELVSQIQNKQLQEGLYKAIKADFEWKKGSEGLKLPQKPPERPETT